MEVAQELESYKSIQLANEFLHILTDEENDKITKFLIQWTVSFLKADHRTVDNDEIANNYISMLLFIHSWLGKTWPDETLHKRVSSACLYLQAEAYTGLFVQAEPYIGLYLQAEPSVGLYIQAEPYAWLYLQT